MNDRASMSFPSLRPLGRALAALAAALLVGAAAAPPASADPEACNHTVDTPAGGETFTIGEQVNITWTKGGSSTWKVELVRLSTGGLTTLRDDASAEESFLWTIPGSVVTGDTISYKIRVTDKGETNCFVHSGTFNVVPNTAPVADDDGPYNATEDTDLVVNAASGVLAGDTDDDGHDIDVVNPLVSQPAHGSVTMNFEDGSFTYTPAGNYNGPDSFTYKATDGIDQSNTATVSITVAAAPDNPTGVADAYTTGEDQALVRNAAQGVLANDIDVDNDPDSNVGLTVDVASVSNPPNGSVSMNADGSFTYTPDGDYNGPDSFTYRAKDPQNNLSAATTVSITVNPSDDPPTADNDGPYNATEDQTLNVNSASGVLTGDVDPEGGDLDVVNPLVSQPAHGSVTMNFEDGSFSYTPVGNYNGPDSFTYRATDGTNNSGVATVSITVAAVADDPTGVADSYSTTEDVTLVRNAAQGVLANDVDVDNNPVSNAGLTAQIVSGPTHNQGPFTLNADGSFTYNPTPNYNGPDSFTYRAKDPQNNLSAVTTVSLTVNPGNDPPTIAEPAIPGATEDVNYSLTINASDPDNASLNFNLTGKPSFLNQNTTATSITLSGKPGFCDSGTYPIGLTVTDGVGGSDTFNFNIVVTNVNRAPEFIGAFDDTVRNFDGDAVNILGSGRDLDNQQCGDTAPVWSATGLPPGLGINASSGNITGTISATASSNSPYSVTITLTDGVFPATKVTGGFIWKVDATFEIQTVRKQGTNVDYAATGETVTITGTKFDQQPSLNVVFENSAAITIPNPANTLTVVVPATAVTGTLAVTNGPVSKTKPFGVVPKINTVSPSPRDVGQTVTIAGTGFDPRIGISKRVVIGTQNAVTGNWNSTSIPNVTIPNVATAGPQTLKVIQPFQSEAQGTSVNLVGEFTGLVVNPTVTSATVSATNGEITILGNALGKTAGSVSVGSTVLSTAGDFTSWDSTRVVVKPADAVRPGIYTVTATVNGQSDAVNSVAVNPIVAAATPASGTAGNALTVSGFYFGPAPEGSDKISFGTLDVTSGITWGAKSLMLPVPTGGKAGSAPIKVTVAGRASSEHAFTVNPAAVLATTSGKAGAVVTINGGAFGTLAQKTPADVVTLNGRTATAILTWTPTQITARVPLGACNGGPTRVTVGGLTANTAAFTLQNPAALTPGSVETSALTFGDGDSLTVTVTADPFLQGSFDLDQVTAGAPGLGGSLTETPAGSGTYRGKIAFSEDDSPNRDGSYQVAVALDNGCAGGSVSTQFADVIRVSTLGPDIFTLLASQPLSGDRYDVGENVTLRLTGVPNQPEARFYLRAVGFEQLIPAVENQASPGQYNGSFAVADTMPGQVTLSGWLSDGITARETGGDLNLQLRFNTCGPQVTDFSISNQADESTLVFGVFDTQLKVRLQFTESINLHGDFRLRSLPGNAVVDSKLQVVPLKQGDIQTFSVTFDLAGRTTGNYAVEATVSRDNNLPSCNTNVATRSVRVRVDKDVPVIQNVTVSPAPEFPDQLDAVVVNDGTPLGVRLLVIQSVGGQGEAGLSAGYAIRPSGTETAIATGALADSAAGVYTVSLLPGTLPLIGGGSGLDDGLYVMVLGASDGVNGAPPLEFVFRVDNAVPLPPQDLATVDRREVAFRPFPYSNGDPFDITLTAEAGQVAVATLTPPGGSPAVLAFTSTTQSYSGRFQIPSAWDGLRGSMTVSVAVYDGVNTSTAVQTTVSIDTSEPEFTLTLDPSGSCLIEDDQLRVTATPTRAGDRVPLASASLLAPPFTGDPLPGSEIALTLQGNVYQGTLTLTPTLMAAVREAGTETFGLVAELARSFGNVATRNSQVTIDAVVPAPPVVLSASGGAVLLTAGDTILLDVSGGAVGDDVFASANGNEVLVGELAGSPPALDDGALNLTQIGITVNPGQTQTAQVAFTLGDGCGNRSTVNTLTVTVDKEPPAVALASTPAFVAGQPTVIQVNATDARGPGAITVNLETFRGNPVTGGLTGIAQTPMTSTGGNTYQATVPATSLTLSGLRYVVTVTDGANTSTLTDAELGVPVTEVPTNATGSFYASLGLAAERWQIISTPAALDGNRTADQIFSAELGERGEQTWKLVQWTADGGNARGGRYENGAAMTPGRGYWFRRKPKDGIDDIFDFGSAKTTPLSPRTVQLTRGWNLIATPFAIPTVWPEDDIVLMEYNFSALAYEDVAPVLRPFTGYFVFADAARTVTLDPAVPITAAKPSPKHPVTYAAQFDGAWAVRFSAVHEGLADVHNYAAVRPDAAAGADAFDLAEAPAPGDLPGLSFAGSDDRVLAADVRPAAADAAETWTFTVHAAEAMLDVDLSWAGVHTVPEGVDLALWDGVTNRAVDLRDRGAIRIDIVAGESYPLTFIAGPAEAVVRELDRLQTPPGARLRLHPVSPNPFLGAARIRYELPEGARVTAEIFDLNGRRVFVSERGPETAGTHAFTWDGRDDHGRRLAAGMYFLRVAAGANEETQKLVLMESGR